jgi:antitoxin VapB
MGEEYRARIFRNGRSRAVRIPAGIDLPGEEVTIRQEGTRVVIEPVRTQSLGEWLATLEPLPPEDWLPDIDDYPPEPVDL